MQTIRTVWFMSSGCSCGLPRGSGGGGLALSSRNTDVGIGNGGGSDGGETVPTSRRKTFLGWGSSDNADDTSRLLRWSRNSLFSRPNVILSSIQLSKDEVAFAAPGGFLELPEIYLKNVLGESSCACCLGC
jgi:hypothetical protein